MLFIYLEKARNLRLAAHLTKEITDPDELWILKIFGVAEALLTIFCDSRLILGH